MAAQDTPASTILILVRTWSEITRFMCSVPQAKVRSANGLVEMQQYRKSIASLVTYFYFHTLFNDFMLDVQISARADRMGSFLIGLKLPPTTVTVTLTVTLTVVHICCIALHAE